MVYEAGLLPGGSEWILILLAVVLLFGGKKIPELMRGIGQGIREFNAAKSNLKQELEEGMRETPKVPQRKPGEEKSEAAS
jgi:sec-independent protein translocase protein TatA